MNTRTMENSSRLVRRLLIFVWAAFLLGATGAKATPVKTLVQDTLYRADGSAAVGTVMIRWNGFSTSAGEAVAAGELTVTTDANGGVSIPLIPNTGSSPAGSYYRIVIKLDDGTTSEELWVVPAVQTTTIAAIRAKVVPQAMAAQFVSRDYLDSALAALDPGSLVYATGAETIQGVLTFVASPEVPTPSDAGSAANKGYVDQEVGGLATVASTGNYNDLVNKPAGVSFAVPGPIGSTTPSTVNATAVSATAVSATTVSAMTASMQSMNGILNPAQYSGADVCAQIAGAVGALPSTGGEIDLRGLNGAQAACAGGIDLSGKPVTLRLGKSTLTLGGALIVGPFSKIKGAGKTAAGSVIQFSSGLGATTDAVTMLWSGTDNDMTTADIDDVYINPQGNGQDALRVRGGRNWKINVEIENAGRDCLVIGGDQAYRWTEQATVDADIFGCGRYGMRLDTSAGTQNYITHLTFPHLHIGTTTSNPIYVAMNAVGSSGGIQEVSFQDLHIMANFGAGDTTDAMYFACVGSTNGYATYWNFYNGEIENGIGNSGYILNGQAGCMGGAVFHNMWLDGRWGAGLYNAATVATPSTLSGQYSNMAGIEVPSTFGVRFDGSTANHTNDLLQSNLNGGLQWLFGAQNGSVQSGGVTVGSARVFNSGASPVGIICPSTWAGSGTLQQFACIGGGQDSGNLGPRWMGYAATGAGGNSAPLYLTAPVWTIDHTGLADFHGGYAVNGNTIIPPTVTGSQGSSTGTKALLASTVSGIGAALCTDSGGAATTTGCVAGGAIPITWMASASGINSSTSQAISSGTLVATTSGGDQVWQIQADAYMLTAGTAGYLTVVLSWTDSYGARTSNAINYQMPFATAGGSYVSTPLQIHILNGTAVTWAVNNNSPTGSWSYQLDLTAQRKR